MGIDTPTLPDNLGPSIEKHNEPNESDIQKTTEALEDNTSLIFECIDTIQDGCSNAIDTNDTENLNFTLKSWKKSDIRKLIVTIKDTPESFTKADIFALLGVTDSKIQKKKNNTRLIDEEQKTYDEKQETYDEKQEKKEDSIVLTNEKQETYDEKQETYDEKQETSDKIKKIEELTSMVVGLPKDRSYSFVISFFESYQNGDFNKTTFDSVINRLKSSPTALQEMVQDVQKQSPEKYEEFKNTLISIDADFVSLFTESENNIFVSKSIEQAQLGITTDNIESDTFGTISNTTGTTTIQLSPEGDRTLTDTQIGYSLEAPIEDGITTEQIKQTDSEFREVTQEIDTSIQTFTNLERIFQQTLSYVENMAPEEQQSIFLQLNQKLRSSFPTYSFTEIHSVDDLQNQTIIVQQKLKEETEKKQQIQEQYEAEIQRILTENEQQIRNIDQKKKEILQFIHKIGLDQVPQNYLDQIINEFRTTSVEIDGLSLAKQNIDLANGNFGEGIQEDSENGTLSEVAKNNLVKFLEKMIYGDTNTPDSIFKGKSFTGELGASIDPVHMQNTLMDRGFFSNGSFNITLARNNLFTMKQKK